MRQFKFDPSKHKKIILAVTVLLLTVFSSNIFIGAYYPGPQYSHKIFQMGPDPTVIIGTRVFHLLLPNNALGEFNTFNPSVLRAIGCAGQFEANSECVQMQSNSTHTAVALTKVPFSLSSAANNNLAISQAWANGGLGPGFTSSAGVFGFYLTTNGTIPTNPGYDPRNDKSVFFDSHLSCTAACGTNNPTVNGIMSILRNIGDTITQEDTGCGPNAGSVFFCNSQSYSLTTTTNNFMLLNYTGFTNSPSITNCSVSPTTSGSGCTFFQNGPVNSATGFATTTFIPPLKIQAHEFYYGLYVTAASPNGGPNILFGSDNNNDDLCCGIKTVNLAQATNGVTTAGFFQPLVDAVVASSVFIFNAFLKFIAFIAPALETGLNFLVSIIQAALNGIGGAIGFPSTSVNCGQAGGSCALGDLVNLLITQLISFVTGTINTLLAQLGPLFTGLANSLSVFVNWIAQAFKFLSDVLSFASGVAVFAFGMFTLSLKWVSFGAGLWLFVFFFAFDAEDGMRGWIRWFNFSKWLIFDIGVNWTMQGINFLIDVMLFFIGLIPKPFIQMSVGKVPRLPLLEIHGSFDVPEFDGAALKEGNLFSILGFLAGFTGFVFFETTSLPGALGSLPGSVFNAQALANMSVAITFYKLFFPVVVLIIFLLMIPTLFSSIFGVRVAGEGLPLSVSTRRGHGGPVSSPRSSLGLQKRTTRISRHLTEKGKRVSGEQEAKKREESLRNRNEEARRQAAKETERINKEAEQQQLSQKRAVEEAKTQEQRNREQTATEA